MGSNKRSEIYCCTSSCTCLVCAGALVDICISPGGCPLISHVSYQSRGQHRFAQVYLSVLWSALLTSPRQVTGLAAPGAGGHARVADMGLARWLTAENMANLTGETGGLLPCEHHCAGKRAQQAAARQSCMRLAAAKSCAALRVDHARVHPVPFRVAALSRLLMERLTVFFAIVVPGHFTQRLAAVVRLPPCPSKSHMYIPAHTCHSAAAEA